ncbi:MAG: Fic family protein [Pseudomonadales bacterium]|jgi:cell filamentation protein|nr:Fic family protein [Pseudomonadales bacterium]
MFDPFRDYAAAGYLRNVAKEKNIVIVKRLEHDVFVANLDNALRFLSARGTITYADFLQVHGLLFKDLYPWAGQDRQQTAPDIAISKAGILFAHPTDAQRAVNLGLQIAHNKEQLREKPGEVIGLFAYAHPFLDCNGRTLLLVHADLCHRAGFSIDWLRSNKDDYLAALSAEIEKPGMGILDTYLQPYVSEPLAPAAWTAIVPQIRGLDGIPAADTIEGSFADPSVLRKYREFEQRRNHE